MPPLLYALLAVIFLGSIPRALAAEDAPVRRVADPLPAVTGKVVTAKLALTGMTCQGCAETIARLLVSIDGVRSAEVDLQARTGVVQFDDARVQPARLVAKVVANGYGASITAVQAAAP